MPASPDKQDHAPFTAPGLVPPAHQQIQLFDAVDQRQMAAAQGLIAALDRAFPQDHTRAFDIAASLEVRQFHRAIFEQIADQVPGGLRNDDGPGIGRRLQAGGQIGYIADHGRLARRSGADLVADHHETAVDADPDPEGAGRAGQGIEARGRIHNRQARTDRPFRIGFVCVRVTEINQGAVTHIAGDKAVECGDQAAGQFVKVRDDLAEVFGVEPLAKRRRPHKIDKHHGHEPALGHRRSRDLVARR